MTHSEFVEAITDTLETNGIEVSRVIDELGQVAASERRDRNEPFTFQDHLRGLVLALLSKQRTWGPIARNLTTIEGIFGGFSPEYVMHQDSGTLAERLKDIQCGNRSIHRQMDALPINIATLRRIQSEYGSMDAFVVSDAPEVIAKRLGTPGQRFKIRELGFTLALEYLRNVGVKAIKPDSHVRRLVGPDRLRWVDHSPSEEETVQLLHNISNSTGMNPTYLDNVLWMFCARDYGDICGAKPRCSMCKLTSVCAQR